ncbi:MAG: LamG domain-containing protein, partial [Planctomycetes bacterium]|nr:LamG domain-containing protein [Planctomycetota bacterium]
MFRKLTYMVSCALLLGLMSNASAELVGQWKLDEGGGTSALDASGNGNEGTLEDDPTVVEGQFGQALAFEASRVTIPASDTLTANLFQGSFTLTAWINPMRTGNTWQQIFRSVRESDTNDTLFLNNDGRLSWRGRVGGAWAGGMCETAPDVVPANQWTHVAVTGDGTNFRVYVNGALSQESAFQTTDGDNVTYFIGGDTNFGESYSGIVDDLRIYNHVLSEDDVRASMENQGGAIVKAYGPDPKSGTLHEDTWISLGWRAGDLAASHDVYIGDNFDAVNEGAEGTYIGNQGETFIVVGFPGFPFPDGLVPGTTYYWRIDEVNDTEPNSPWKGDIWNFSIPPKTAYFPDPADSAESVSVDVQLSWTSGFGAKLHTVYFGETFNEVETATGGQAQGTTTFTPGTLKMAKTYYWRVDEFDVVETHKGNVWSFTTEGAVTALDP